MNDRDRQRRLADIASGLPSLEDIEVARQQRIKEAIRARVDDGSASAEDFVALFDDSVGRRALLEQAGKIRFWSKRGQPSEPGLDTDARLLATWPLEEQPPPHLYERIREVAYPADSTRRGSRDWVNANRLLVLLGPDQGESLRREYYAHLCSYDPEWRSLLPEGGFPSEMVERVEAGTADERDFFFAHMANLRPFMNEFMVAAVGHRQARLAGEPRQLESPGEIAAELISYPPDETPPERLWQAIRLEADRPPTPESIVRWREFNRCRVVVGRWDHGKRVRGFLEENWDLYEAEYRYVTSRGELP